MSITKRVKDGHLWITFEKEESQFQKTETGLLKAKNEKDERSAKIGALVQAAQNLVDRTPSGEVVQKYKEGDRFLLSPNARSQKYNIDGKDYYLIPESEILTVLW